MEIQKVFSDYYDTERMYSVLMSEDELRLYSELQKEFGIKEALGKYISKARNGVAKKLDQSIIRDLEKATNANISFQSTKNDLKVLNKKNRTNLYKKAHEMNAKVHGIPSQVIGQGTSSTGSTQVLKNSMGRSSLLNRNQEELFDTALKHDDSLKSALRNYHGLSGTDLKKSIKRSKKVARDVNNSRADDIIFHETKEGDTLLAHELGHIGNRREGSFIRKKINKFANDPKLREDLNTLNNGRLLKTTGNPFKKYIEGKVIVAEERGATERGIKYMKEAGYSPEDIERVKKLMLDKDGASDTYKHLMNARWKASLRNKIATPDHKGILLI